MSALHIPWVVAAAAALLVLALGLGGQRPATTGPDAAGEARGSSPRP